MVEEKPADTKTTKAIGIELSHTDKPQCHCNYKTCPAPNPNQPKQPFI
jgi:hypothetical protein